MAEETTDKSIVIWHPSLVYRVPDVREWTSLCLFHDQVILCSFFAMQMSAKKSKNQFFLIGR